MEIQNEINQKLLELKGQLQNLDEDSEVTPYLKDKVHDRCINYLLAYYKQENRQRGDLYNVFQERD